MKRAELGIGFIAGRKNVCDIINNYYKKLLEQIEGQANLTFFILYDLEYNGLEKEDFYNINPKVYKSGIKVQYIGEEEIQLEKNRIQEKHHLNKKEVDLVIGHGYGKARNTIMYWALKNNIDYLMFWDDDEYPVACIKDADTKKLIWKEQCNIKEHLKNIMNNDITIGYRCGYDAPIPYIEYDNTVTEEDFKDFIDGISNEVIHWKSIQKKVIEQKGITYADKLHLEEKPARTSEWIYGSGICINLKRIDKIPAFYNPPNARGEDTFFSIQLKDANICKVPIYHFHDGFLQYKDIMKEKYPQKLDKIKLGSKDIEKRFFNASIGWIKYKPLFLYITQKESYRQLIEEAMEKLQRSIPKMNQLFKNSDFICLLDTLQSYNEQVESHYEEYVETNRVWNLLKEDIEIEKITRRIQHVQNSNYCTNV